MTNDFGAVLPTHAFFDPWGSPEAFLQWTNVEFPAFKASVDTLDSLDKLTTLYNVLVKQAEKGFDSKTADGIKLTSKIDYVKAKLLTLQGDPRAQVRPPKRG